MTYFLCIWWLGIIWVFSDIFPRPFDDPKNTILYVGGGLWVAWVLWQRGIAVPRTRLSLGIAAYITICVLSIVMSPGGYWFGFEEMSQLVIWMGIMWSLSLQTSRTFIYLSTINVISAGGIAVLTQFHMQGILNWSYISSILPPIGHMTYYGDFMALQLPLLIYLTTHVRRPYKLPCIATLASLILLGLWQSGRRASILGSIVGITLACILLLAYNHIRWRQLLCTLILCAIAIGASTTLSFKNTNRDSVIERFSSIFNKSAEEASSNRLHTYFTTLSIIANRPIRGWGLDNFRFVYPEYAHRKDLDSVATSQVWYMHPHNELLHQAMELGIPGLILFLAGCIYLFRRGLKGIAYRSADQQIAIISSLSGLTIALVSWQFSTNYIMPVSRVLVAFFVGILFHATAGEDAPVRVTLKKMAAIIVLALTLKVALNQTALVYVQRTQTAPTLPERTTAARTAVRLAPHNFDAQFTLAAHLMQAGSPEASLILSRLHHEYPFVPSVLYMMGIQALRDGNPVAAKVYLDHCLHNDPSHLGAYQALKQLNN